MADADLVSAQQLTDKLRQSALRAGEVIKKESEDGGGLSPICSTMSGGKTREAKALRKMSENSLSRPPIPIFSKFQSGLMIVCLASLVFALPVTTQEGAA